jgi:glycyl-tRNA synthetase
VEALVAVPDRKALGMAFKKDAAAVLEALAALDDAGAEQLKTALESGEAPLALGCSGATVTLTPAHVKVEKQTKKLTGRNIVPSVIEPSFGLGRIIYCVFEHCFYTRPNDATRSVFKFAPAVAPVKVTIFPLLNRPEMDAAARRVEAALRGAGLASLLDTTAVTIGKRYARTDEIGVPFGVTVDGTTLEDGTVTLRERDTMAQVRVPGDALPGVVKALVDGARDWASVAAEFPAQAVAEDK